MINQTKTITGTQNLTEFDLLTLEDNSTYKWNCLAYDTASNSDWGDKNFTLIINSSYNLPPEVILQYPPHNGINIPGDVTLNVTVIDPEGSAMNVTYFGREKNDTDWTLVAIPDTQRYTWNDATTLLFKNQTLWINSSRNDENIIFVTHEGDIVDDWNVIAQWNNANASMSILDDQVPYGVLPGNHDMNSTRGTPYYNQYFPPERFNNKSWYGGNYSRNDNNYEFFSVGGVDYIIIHLEFCPRNEVITWANNVLKNNTNRSAIITTHGYLHTSLGTDGKPRRDVQSPLSPCTAQGTENTQYIWDRLIYPNNNTFLVLAGHVEGEASRTDNNFAGKPVHQILANYQAWYNQQSGFLRRMKFIPSQNKIEIKTYSPYLNQNQCPGAGGEWRSDGCYKIGEKSEFTLDDTSANLGRNLNVINGTNATFLWKNLKASTTYEWYVEVMDSKGAKTIGPRWNFTTTT